MTSVPAARLPLPPSFLVGAAAGGLAAEEGAVLAFLSTTGAGCAAADMDPLVTPSATRFLPLPPLLVAEEDSGAAF